ncbi:PadR family transcriptional regulator [Salimicrobium halophilum]|uniref:DNA-binding transcriptional regulator, PadR family n=1 Tax=Salimicrobium halophilum TaxID=86666 RepID=A0A1G8R4R1_9BACI|nr:helix-turn-helix transcriptional regulator [Salimicrobium halophilum]SDJ11962.1 DNA-binding transcriptional regulator, PadR family [Salimicrobium halophilum]
MDREIMKGSIDILMLNLISRRDRYGYEIVRDLKQQSEALYNMSEGTLYPALKRLEKKEWLSSYWSETDSGRRKYYRITGDGREVLDKKLEDWKSVNDLIIKTSEDLS